VRRAARVYSGQCTAGSAAYRVGRSACGGVTGACAVEHAKLAGACGAGLAGCKVGGQVLIRMKAAAAFAP